MGIGKSWCVTLVYPPHTEAGTAFDPVVQWRRCTNLIVHNGMLTFNDETDLIHMISTAHQIEVAEEKAPGPTEQTTNFGK